MIAAEPPLHAVLHLLARLRSAGGRGSDSDTTGILQASTHTPKITQDTRASQLCAPCSISKHPRTNHARHVHGPSTVRCGTVQSMAIQSRGDDQQSADG